jgi:hypothetical protein
MELALLFKHLATLRVDRTLLRSVDDLLWTGPSDVFGDVSRALDAGGLSTRTDLLARKRSE